jgi:hypothetical protein
LTAPPSLVATNRDPGPPLDGNRAIDLPQWGNYGDLL